MAEQWLDKWSYNGWTSGVTMAGQGQKELQWLDKRSYGITMAGCGVTMAGQMTSYKWSYNGWTAG